MLISDVERIGGLLKITFTEILSVMKCCNLKIIKREIGLSLQTCSLVFKDHKFFLFFVVSWSWALINDGEIAIKIEPIMHSARKRCFKLLALISSFQHN